jgi:hypothetical protein
MRPGAVQGGFIGSAVIADAADAAGSGRVV